MYDEPEHIEWLDKKQKAIIWIRISHLDRLNLHNIRIPYQICLIILFRKCLHSTKILKKYSLTWDTNDVFNTLFNTKLVLLQ